MSSHTFTSVDTVLKSLARSHGLEVRLFEYRLRTEWPDIVGETIAAHTRPDRIRFKKLYLLAENSVWLQQLLFLKPTLLEKINTAADRSSTVPIVSDIVLRIGEFGTVAPLGDPAAAVPDHVLAPSPAIVAQAAHYARNLKDPDLRISLTKVIAKALSLVVIPQQE